MFSILRIEKIKTRSQISASQNHNLRLTAVSNADPSKSHLNRTSGAKSYKELIAELEDRFFKFGITPRKDAVQVVEVILTASPEFFTGISDEKLKEWVQANFKWAKEEFSGNLLQFTLHLDESTPHIHLLFTPITPDGRLSMKDLYGGREKLSALQTRYAQRMEFFGLKRGIENSKAKHNVIKKFYSLVNDIEKIKKSENSEYIYRNNFKNNIDIDYSDELFNKINSSLKSLDITQSSDDNNHKNGKKKLKNKSKIK